MGGLSDRVPRSGVRCPFHGISGHALASLTALQPYADFARFVGRLDMHDARTAADGAVLRVRLPSASSGVDVEDVLLAAERTCQGTGRTRWLILLALHGESPLRAPCDCKFSPQVTSQSNRNGMNKRMKIVVTARTDGKGRASRRSCIAGRGRGGCLGAPAGDSGRDGHSGARIRARSAAVAIASDRRSRATAK